MMNRVFKRRQPKKFTDFNTKPSQRVKMSLRVRDNNQINVDNNNLIPQGRALKRSAEFQVLKLCEDEPVAKRPIKAGECEAISSYQIDAIKKNSTTILSLRKNKFERLLPLKDVFDAEELEVDPCPGFDFDKENSNDPNSVSEFACDIFKYLKWREPHFMPTNYIGRHKYLNGKSRAVLVDWLVEVHGAFKQNHETLYMAVNLVDRFFSNSKKITRGLQLVTCAAALVAAKFEERSAPLIDDLIYLVKDAFSADTLKQMEQDLLSTVGFDLCAPLSYSFLRRYGRVIKADMALLTLSRYILEVSLHFLDFCRLSPSKMAAASLLLALKMTKTGTWNSALHKYSTYVVEDIEELAWSLNHMICVYRTQYPDIKVVWGKYSHKVFFEVAKIETLKDKYLQDAPIVPPPQVQATDEKLLANRH